MAGRHGARPLRRPLARRHARQPVAAAGPEAAGGARRRARLHADVRLRARVLPPQGDLRRGPREALRGPDSVGALHPRLPHPRHDLRRAFPPPDPQPHAGGRRSRSRARRARRGPASRRSTSATRRALDDGRQPHGLQERRQGDRAPERLLDHVHGEARPHLDRELLPHPREPLARRRERVRGRVRRLQAVPRRADRVLPRARPLPRAERQLLQALRRRELGADHAGLGARQPHVRLPHRRPRQRRCAPRPGSPAGT